LKEKRYEKGKRKQVYQTGSISGQNITQKWNTISPRKNGPTGDQKGGELKEALNQNWK